jgi:hypothetical protein
VAEKCEYRRSYATKKEKGKRNMCKCGTKEDGSKCGEKKEAVIVEQKPVCCSTGQVKAVNKDCCSGKTE